MIRKEKQETADIIFGVHPVVELLKARRRKLVTIYTTKPTPKSWAEISALLPAYVSVRHVTRDALTNLAGTPDHQGVVAYVQPFQFRKEFFNVERERFLIMLDSVQDVRNAGAIIRSAYCVGVQGVILVSKHAAPLSGAAFKASAGLAEHISIFVAHSPSAAVTALKKAGYSIYLAALGGKSVLETEFAQPLCLVIGNEATGVSKEISNAGVRVMLPQRNAEISYNASAAASILMFFVGVGIGQIGKDY